MVFALTVPPNIKPRTKIHKSFFIYLPAFVINCLISSKTGIGCAGWAIQNSNHKKKVTAIPPDPRAERKNKGEYII